MYYRSILVFLLLSNYCCNASPLPVTELSEQSTTKASIPLSASAINDHWVTLQKLHEYEFLRMLCELYGRCNDDEDVHSNEPMFGYHQGKFKRLSPRLFYGIPKFG